MGALKSLSLAVFIVAPVIFSHPNPLAGQSAIIPEYRVKATFLFQFTQFVDWPPEAFPTGQAPLVIGILGDDPFGTFLDETVRDEKANGHPLAVERYAHVEEIRNCQLLFVGHTDASKGRDVLAALKGRKILTVGDSNDFADRGGMIQFFIQDNKVRLRINLEAARAATLTISSKLLRPATVINTGAR